MTGPPIHHTLPQRQPNVADAIYHKISKGSQRQERALLPDAARRMNGRDRKSSLHSTDMVGFIVATRFFVAIFARKLVATSSGRAVLKKLHNVIQLLGS